MLQPALAGLRKVAAERTTSRPRGGGRELASSCEGQIWLTRWALARECAYGPGVGHGAGCAIYPRSPFWARSVWRQLRSQPANPCAR